MNTQNKYSKKVLAIFVAITSALFGLMAPYANAASGWKYGTGMDKLNGKLSSLGLKGMSSSDLGKLPKTNFGSWPGSYSDSISYSYVSDGYTPAYGEGAFFFVKGNESNSSATTIVNFELPKNQTIYSDGDGYWFTLLPFDEDGEEGNVFGQCSEPTKATVSGNTLSVTIQCNVGQGFQGYFAISSMISQAGLYENAIVYKAGVTKRTPGNMFKLRMPETNLVDPDVCGLFC